MPNEDVLSMDTLPDSSSPNVDVDVPHKLTIADAEEVTTTNGCKSLQCSYVVDDSKIKVNYDNCIINLANGSPCDYGRSKLKKILKATNTEIVGSFTIKMAAQLLKGKSFQAMLEKNTKGYLALPTNLDSILPLEAPKLEPKAEPENLFADTAPTEILTSEDDKIKW